MTAKVRFDSALEHALELVRAHLSQLGGSVVVVRDLMGCIRVAVENDAGLNKAQLDAFRAEFSSRLGAFAPEPQEVLLLRSELFVPETLFGTPDAWRMEAGIRLLERQVTGADWFRRPLCNREPRPPRATLYGLKGGVGRSTTLAFWARHLAASGRRVLVIDLDLESPGLSSAMLPHDALPSFGVVDWFMEDMAGQADEAMLRDMVASSPLAQGTPGEIHVVPAGGSVGHYLPKLARVYMDKPRPEGPLPFAERLGSMVDALEEIEKPDVVLLDSRAGLHDIAAVSLTRLEALALLFAVATPQTWHGYQILLSGWQQQFGSQQGPDDLRSLRPNLQMVAAQIPETERAAYLERFRERAYELFIDHMYDEVEPQDMEAFSFDLNDEEAPHSPIPIYWRREIQDLDPLSAPSVLTEDQVRAAFGSFFDRATSLLLRGAH